MTRYRVDGSGAIVPALAPGQRDPKRRLRSSARWQRVRARQLQAQPWCAECGSTTQLTADHIVPLARGGSPYSPANVQTLCAKCNRAKGAL